MNWEVTHGAQACTVQTPRLGTASDCNSWDPPTSLLPNWTLSACLTPQLSASNEFPQFHQHQPRSSFISKHSFYLLLCFRHGAALESRDKCGSDATPRLGACWEMQFWPQERDEVANLGKLNFTTVKAITRFGRCSYCFCDYRECQSGVLQIRISSFI